MGTKISELPDGTALTLDGTELFPGVKGGTTYKLNVQQVLGASAPFYPVIHPSSGNLQGSGSPIIHQLVWSNTNPNFSADVLNFVSTDPSALASITVTGTTATGTLTVSYTFNATTINVPVGVTTGQTTTQVAAAIVAAIQATATLFTAASGGNTAGGYASGALIGFITNSANVVQYDYNSTVATQVKYTAGTTALTLTFQAGQSTVSTNYTLPTALDNNPVFSVARNSGAAPAAGSQLFTINSQGTNSASPSSISTSYGVIQNRVVSSVAGAIAGSWIFALPDITGALSKGLTLTASALTPTADNVVALGSAILNYSEVFTYALSVPGAASGAALIVAQGTAGNPTLTLPNTTGTFAVGASGNLALNATTGNLTISASPTFATSVTSPLVIGGTATSSSLTLQSTSGAGATDSILFQTGSQVTRAAFATGGQLMIGVGAPWTASATSYLDINRNTAAPPAVSSGLDAIHLTAADSNAASFVGDSFGTNTFFVLERAQGTNASRTALVGGNQIGSMAFKGYDGSVYQTGATISGVAYAGYGVGDRSTFLSFSVVAQSSTTLTEQMRLQASGGLSLGNGVVGTDPGVGALLASASLKSNSATAGVGYATGAGGTITQGTSKATGVTLNTATGAITMNNAALAAATIVSFVLTDSAIAATDVLILNHISGGTPGSYTLNARAAAGTATIDVRNNTAGSLSEAIVIEFAVIKGVTA